jgi:membrane protein required for colicin V production
MILTAWDWFVLIVGMLSVLLGLWRGMIRTVFALAGWLVALLGTPLLLPVVAEYVQIGQTWMIAVPLFILLLVVVRLMGGLIAASLNKAGLGGVDRLLGSLLGVVRAAIIVAVFAVLAKQFNWHEQPAWKLAQTRPILEAMVYWIEPLLPERFSGIKST